MEKESEFGYSYEAYKYMAQELAQKGRYADAQEIIEIMISKWPEKLIAKSKRTVSKMDIPNKKLKTRSTIP